MITAACIILNKFGYEQLYKKIYIHYLAHCQAKTRVFLEATSLKGIFI